MLRFPSRWVTWVVYSCAVVAIATTASSAQQQTPAPAAPSAANEPKFEVASVKKNPAGLPQNFRFGLQPNGRFGMPGMPVSNLITLAYGIQPFQLVGATGWMTTDRFEINAVEEDLPIPPSVPGAPTHMQLLLRSLLKERFALVIHNETRELPLSYLVMAREDRKLGERLRPSTVECQAFLAELRKAAREAREGGPPAPPPSLKPGEISPCGRMGGPGRIASGSMTMSTLASFLAISLSRPVYDRTNLTGNFEVQLEYTPDQMPQIPPGATLPPGFTLPSPDGPSLMTALQEQLGLKLDNTRGPVDVIVIDSVEQPTPD